MRKITRRALTVAAAAVVSTGVAVAPASAGPLLVDVSMPSESGPTAQVRAQNEGNLVGAAQSGGVMICSDVLPDHAVTGDGQVEIGTNLPASGAITPPDGIGAVTSNLHFTNCTVSGQPAEVTIYDLPWGLFPEGETSGGITPGYLQGVRVDVSVPALQCNATFQGVNGDPGVIHGEYTNPVSGGPGTLDLPFGAPNNLEAANTGPNCAGIVSDHDTVTLAGTIELYGVNSTNNEGPTVSAHL